MALTVVQPGVGGTGATTFPSPGTSGNVLTSNGTNWTSSAPASGYAGPGGQVFTSNGTFTIPSGITKLKVTVVGGGGGAGGYSTGGAGGGGGGGTAIKYLTDLTAGNTISVVVGSGGAGGGYYTGSAGGVSYIASGSQSITPVYGYGGNGGVGTGGGGSGAGGTGGSAVNGTINIAGQNGGNGSEEASINMRNPGVGGLSTMGYPLSAPAIFVYAYTQATVSLGYGSGQTGVCGPYQATNSGNSGIVIFEW